MAFMPEDVLNKNFTATQFRRGYDEHEVDDFLDEIVVELRRLTGENEELAKQLKACQEDRGVIPSGAKDKIAAARVSAEQAERESAARIAKAQAEAEHAESQAAERLRAEKDSGLRIARANADADRAEALAAQRKREAEEAANDIARSAFAVPAAPKDHGRAAPAEVAAGVGVAGLGSAAGVLALAEKLHAEYVSEGQKTRERLIGEGQLRHDQVIGEANAKQEQLRYSAQAKHDALIAEATGRHEQMITEARERAAGMVAEAQQKRAEVLQTLGHERSLLQQKIDELRTFERDYRARLKSHLEGQLRELDQIGASDGSSNGDVKQRG
jgi:DivIVA domain-containing protein